MVLPHLSASEDANPQGGLPAVLWVRVNQPSSGPMTTGTEVTNALEFSRLVHRMVEDVDLVGDALLLAIGAAERMHFPDRYPAKSDRSWSGIARRVFGAGRRADDKGFANRALRSVIAADIPRYDWISNYESRRCVAPMIRRAGPCGQRASLTWMERDPVTGEGELVGLCLRHEKLVGAEFRGRRMQRHREWQLNGEPEPAANAGGILARYFDTDWQHMYEWASPYRAAQAKPEGKPATPPRPILTLVRD